MSSAAAGTCEMDVFPDYEVCTEHATVLLEGLGNVLVCTEHATEIASEWGDE